MTPKFIKTKLKGLGSLAKKGINAFGIKMRYRSTETSPTAIKDILAVLDPRFRSPVLSPNAIENILGVLDPYFRSPLLSMYRDEPQLGTDGQLHPISEVSGIPPSVGIWIYNLCVSVRPKATIEIGMAYGFSTLYFLAAIAKCQIGHHTAIDPFQSSLSYGIGLRHAQTVASTKGSASAFRLIEDRSDRVATDLARTNCTFEVILIDGNHRFDDVLVDFYLYAPLCTIGGYIIFDDMWMSSIQTAVAFVRSNRSDFVEVRSAEPRICVFQKVGDDSREWTDFRQFVVAPSTY